MVPLQRAAPGPGTGRGWSAAGPGDPTGLPDEILRSLCDAFRISIDYDRTTRQVRYTAEIEASTISHLRDRLATPHLQICDVPPAGIEPATIGLEAEPLVGDGWAVDLRQGRGSQKDPNPVQRAFGVSEAPTCWLPYKRRTFEGLRGGDEMATKTRRIEMRADQDSEERIAHAASLLGQSMSAFVLGAARREADAVLARADTTLMAPEQFDLLLSSLDTADEAPSLRAAARASRRAARA